MKIEDKIGYQIFPRSFNDANRDGNGDIQGIIDKLDYLKELGIDIIWLCPIYKTKFLDAGYDVINYFEIDEIFGTIGEFKILILEAEKRNMHIMMDIVLNHGSDLSLEFQEACKSRDSEYFDYYIWNDKPNLEDPSIFGGSAWEYVDAVKSYYLHIFAKSQPDFNWDNPKLRKFIYKMLNFWIDLGVNYFRLDAVEHIGKTTDPFVIRYGKHNKEYLVEMYDQVFKNKNAITVGESWSITPKLMKEYANKKDKAIDTFFNFSMLAFDWKNERGSLALEKNKVNFSELKGYFDWQKEKLVTATSWTNHDIPRSLDRYLGNTKGFIYEKQTLLNTLLLTTKGIPFFYQGEEFGMSYTEINSMKDFRDGAIDQQYNSMVNEEKIYTNEEFLKAAKTGSRDLSRSIMSWNAGNNSGFNNEKKLPWMNLSIDYKTRNQEMDYNSEKSIFKYTKELIKLRKNKYYQFFCEFDDIKLLECEKNHTVYVLKSKGSSMAVALNFSNKEIKIENLWKKTLETVFSNYKTTEPNLLKEYQAIIWKIEE
ncbi:MAG: hypothetical protein KFW07_01610 [Mycoplasmataceae bacterium]|nr:hypothetical protein [Mycoplasmataceae bacterium]